MYQLLRRGSYFIDNARPLSLRSLNVNSRLNSGEKTTLLCKLLNIKSQVQIRSKSSITNSNSQEPEKKRKRRSKKNKPFADVLVLTQEYLKLKRASVTKLTPSELKLLTTTDVYLNELYKLKNASKHLQHAEQNLVNEELKVNVSIKPKERPVIINQKSNDDCAAEAELSATDFERLASDGLPQSSQTEVSHDRESSSELLLKQRNVIASKTLATYIDVWNHAKNPQRGLKAFYYHQDIASRKQETLSRMNDINVYHGLLTGFSNKGDFAKVTEVLRVMKEEGIPLDTQCYLAIFECLGRINLHNNHLKDIRIYVKEAYSSQITFDKIFNEGIFLNDQRDQVLKAALAYNPRYVPLYKKPKLWYANHLIDHLNNEKMEMDIELDPKLDQDVLLNNCDIKKLIEKQLALEEKGFITIRSVETQNEPTKQAKKYRSVLEEHYKSWTMAARAAFKREMHSLVAEKHVLNMEPYLRCVPAEDLVELMVQEAIKIAQGSETYSMELPMLYRSLGTKVHLKYCTLRKQKTGVMDKILSIHSKYCQNYAIQHNVELGATPDHEVSVNTRVQWQLIQHKECQTGTGIDLGHHSWVPSTLTYIGKFLYNIIMHDFMIDVNCTDLTNSNKKLERICYTIFRTQDRIRKEEIKPHPMLSKLYKLSQMETLTFPANEIPMCCPPVPWTSIHNGGYLISPTQVVRLPHYAWTQKKRLQEADPQKLYPNLDALNQLASVSWKVNTRILDLIVQVFRAGGSAKLDVPENPEKVPTPPPLTKGMSIEEKNRTYKAILQHKRKIGEMYSLWCDCLYRLSLANHFRNDIFWLPHNMDFRGRVYPVPPHLNHLGSDLARSMLMFAESRPLGATGFDWLKIHLVNLTGLRKRHSNEARLRFANESIDLILDSADDPLGGKRWWTESDEPWQTLACCMEVADVIRSGVDPAEYRSHFPVHQDGSCNGLQHYAALGRDSAGAHSVNLTPCDVPQDVYSFVVDLVEERRAKDEAEGVEIARILKGHIQRKVIKQTIMTTVYGVTRFGARLQIAKQLNDIDGFPKEHVFSASHYLTSLTFESLRTMFKSTKEIQDWFTECAKLISGVGWSLVEWVTPLGLPIVQPYVKYKKPSMPKGYEGFAIDQYEKPNTLKQKNAFPPNFVHSLDSSHMMLTSLNCERAGITFVSVHDCYWTHPSTVRIMNRICREQFVALHSEPILENLSVFMYDLYAYDEDKCNDADTVAEQNRRKLNMVLQKLPNKGDFDIRNVLDSEYFFS